MRFKNIIINGGEKRKQTHPPILTTPGKDLPKLSKLTK